MKIQFLLYQILAGLFLMLAKTNGQTTKTKTLVKCKIIHW